MKIPAKHVAHFFKNVAIIFSGAACRGRIYEPEIPEKLLQMKTKSNTKNEN